MPVLSLGTLLLDKDTAGTIYYDDLIIIHRPPSIGGVENLLEGLIRAKKESLLEDIG